MQTPVFTCVNQNLNIYSKTIQTKSTASLFCSLNELFIHSVLKSEDEPRLSSLLAVSIKFKDSKKVFSRVHQDSEKQAMLSSDFNCLIVTNEESNQGRFQDSFITCRLFTDKL